MGEYFDLSLIYKKNSLTSKKLKKVLLEEFALSEGENKTKYFSNKKVLITSLSDNQIDFDELCISLENQEFTESSFELELGRITNFVNRLFERVEELEFVLCSYELNGYLLSDIKRLKDFDEDFLNNFPLYYKRQSRQAYAKPVFNKSAQEIIKS
ncbi:MAG: hypothetical protein KDK66_06935 [Deltaproteobacteria bacterium]|nr:hypothetical protein [Deltaproteobacteria bacterium]